MRGGIEESTVLLGRAAERFGERGKKHWMELTQYRLCPYQSIGGAGLNRFFSSEKSTTLSGIKISSVVWRNV